MKSLLRHPLAQAAAVSMLSAYLTFALRTTRWTLAGREYFSPHAAGAPVIFAFWHEFLPLIPALTMLARRLPEYVPTPMHALVSQHRDGRLIGAVVKRFGIDPILGSSTRGGANALRKLLDVLRRRHIIGITPDGPKGPRRVSASGVAQLSALSAVPVIPVAARTNRHITLKTWDRMVLPMPFGQGVLVCGAPIDVPRQNWEHSLPDITNALNATADLADRLCQR
jgi:lysophospholipid acyltransferase (LPLAT)-like uncharacterized protein